MPSLITKGNNGSRTRNKGIDNNSSRTRNKGIDALLAGNCIKEEQYVTILHTITGAGYTKFSFMATSIRKIHIIQ